MKPEWFSMSNENIERLTKSKFAAREWKKDRDTAIRNFKWYIKLEREVARLGGDVEALRDE